MLKRLPNGDEDEDDEGENFDDEGEDDDIFITESSL